MKTFLVKIDRKSVKPNPNAGKNKFHEFVSTECRITIEGKHDRNDFKDCILIHQATTISAREVTTDESVYFPRPFQKCEDLMDWLETLSKKYGDRFHYTLQNNYQETTLLSPQPAFLFKYKPTKVKCRYCKKTFDYTKLGEDYIDDGDDETLVENMCPECGEGYCCELEFERIETLLLKKLKLPKLVIK